MKQIIGVLILAMSMSGCALVTKIKSTPITPAQVVSLLDAAQLGVDADNALGGLSQADYLTVRAAIRAARSVAEQLALHNDVNLSTVRDVLTNFVAALPPGSVLAGYVNFVLDRVR